MTSAEPHDPLLREPAEGGATAAPDARPAQWPIEVLIPADRGRAWARVLVEALGARFALPAEMRRVTALTAPQAIPFEDFERRAGGGPLGHSAWIDARSAASSDDIAGWAGRMVVNATGRAPQDLPAAVREATILSPTFEGGFGLQALAMPLAARAPVHLGVVASAGGTTRTLYGARLAPTDRTRLDGALDAALARTITMLCGAVGHLIDGSPCPDVVPPPEPAPVPGAVEFWVRRLAAAGPPRLGRALGLRDAWAVGVRPLQAETGPAELDLDPAGFDRIEIAPRHFYADPFLLRHEGITALFFEDYDFDQGRARISRVVLDPDAAPSPPGPEPALARPYHLSYPFAFVHDGAALMLPETSANRTIELYEAESFPDKWRLRSVLIDGVDASDSTLHYDEATGLWWIFTTVSEFGGSSHDGLWLFFSERLEGPWRPHPGNPVKLDPAGSRPAGPLLPWNGRLYRPTQDCSRAYGGGLAWFEIKRLDPYGFREDQVDGQAERHPHLPVHTYGRAAGWEVVDFKMRRWRYLM